MAELNETMTVSEFLRWRAFYEMYPFATEDLNFGRLLHLLASIHAPKDHKPKLSQFLLGMLPEEQPSLAELEAKMDALAQRMNRHD